MPFNLGDLDYDANMGFGPYEATVTNAGAGISKFGPEIILVCQPTNPKRRTQNLHMSMGKGDFKFDRNQQVITTGEGEKAFDVTVYDEIISGPKIKVMTNAGLFLNILKHLGFELAGGNINAFVGMKLDLEERKANDVIEIFNEAHPKTPLDKRTGSYENGKITIPTKIISMPAKKVPLAIHVLDFIATEKTENEVIAWCGESKERSMKEVFDILKTHTESGAVIFDGGTYLAQKVRTND